MKIPKVFSAALLCAVFLGLGASGAASQDKPLGADCRKFAPEPRDWFGREVGVEACRITGRRVVFDAKGRRVLRLEIALDGTVGGWSAEDRKPGAGSFTDAPEIALAQRGATGRRDPGERKRGVARYEGKKGAGITLFVPMDRGDWNGRLFITAHGARAYAPVGRLVPRDGADEFHPLANVNKFVGLMIDKGYAVAHTRRPSGDPAGEGGVTVTLDGGRERQGYRLGQHAGLIAGWTRLARAIVTERLGARPEKTYLYGFSSGAELARLFNYSPRFNDDARGGHLFDGILADDARRGGWLPVLERDGRDVLFRDEAARTLFVPQIDLAHLLYEATDAPKRIDAMRRNARLLLKKGLGEKHRLYEIRGVSHFDAGYGPEDMGRGRDLTFQNLDLTPVVSAMIDRLDEWATKGTAPPPTRSDDPDLGGRGEGEAVKNPAIALPPVACPLGVFHAWPAALGHRPIGGRVTGFAAFDGANPEPKDGRGRLVDMNGNGERDRRETITQAWRRVGLLKDGEGFTRLVYTSCVNQTSERLSRAGLITKPAELHYKHAASRTLLPGVR